MKKYILQDIKLKSPGVQIREKIIEKYGSIKEFADAIDLYESSIHQYLSSKTLGSSTFKIRTTRVFETDFNELFESDKDQVARMVSDVSYLIDDYNKVDDIDILNALKMMTLEREYFEEYAVICRCYAYYYYNQGQMDRALAYIDVAVNTMRNRENVDRFGLYFSDMILMKSSSFTKTEFKKVKKEFDEIIKKVSGPLTTGHMYRNLGKAYFSLEDYPLSQRYYKKVLTYHHDEKSISFVYMRLGDIKKEQGHYDDAWNYYIKAEKLLSDEDTTVYHVYDEYAKYYLYKEEYEQANKYMDRIFNNSEWLISSLDHSFVVTYNQVKDKLKKYDDIEKVLKRLLNELNSGYIYASHHLDKFGGTVSLLDCPDSTLERFLRIAVGFQQKNNLSRGMNKIVKMFLGDIVIQMKKDI